MMLTVFIGSGPKRATKTLKASAAMFSTRRPAAAKVRVAGPAHFARIANGGADLLDDVRDQSGFLVGINLRNAAAEFEFEFDSRLWCNRIVQINSQSGFLVIERKLQRRTVAD